MPYAQKPIRPHWVPERKPFNTSVDNQKFYNSARWRKVALAFREKNPTCVHCEEKGIVKESEVTDHIKPITNGGAEYDEANLQALCHSCHNSKSGKEGANSRKTRVVTKRSKPNEKK